MHLLEHWKEKGLERKSRSMLQIGFHALVLSPQSAHSHSILNKHEGSKRTHTTWCTTLRGWTWAAGFLPRGFRTIFMWHSELWRWMRSSFLPSKFVKLLSMQVWGEHPRLRAKRKGSVLFRDSKNPFAQFCATGFRFASGWANLVRLAKPRHYTGTVSGEKSQKPPCTALVRTFI